MERWEKTYYGNPEKAKARQKKYYSKNKEWIKKFRNDLRRETVEAYGGKCVCCDEARWQFLTIDHIDGNGQSDRDKYRNVTGQLYGWLKRFGFPQKGYRVLCMNCNWIRRFGGVCPHDSEREARERHEMGQEACG